MSDAFSRRHPLINFIYFTLIIGFSMFLMHPLCLAISLLGAVSYALCLKGRKALRFLVCAMLPLLLVTAWLNPLFNHAGVTLLFYLPGGNPVTLESMVYGLAAATMFVTVVVWFSCFNAVMTSDKFVYLFGEIIPALSLIFSMVLRLVPRLKAQSRVIANARKGVGRDPGSGPLLQRARSVVQIISMMITWALESAIDTADSMKSRGYGLAGRTSFSLYRFELYDKWLLAAMLLLAGFILAGAGSGLLRADYFPALQIETPTLLRSMVYMAYAGLGLLPVLVDGGEDMRWKRIKSTA